MRKLLQRTRDWLLCRVNSNKVVWISSNYFYILYAAIRLFAFGKKVRSGKCVYLVFNTCHVPIFIARSAQHTLHSYMHIICLIAC